MPAQGLTPGASSATSPRSESAGRRRLGLLTLLAAAALGAWALDRWDPPADPDPRLVRETLIRAESALRRYSPAEAEELSRRTGIARASIAPGRWDDPLSFAARGLRGAALRRQEAEHRWRGQKAALAAEVGRARERLETPGLGRAEAEQMRIAALAWDRALRRASRGDFGAALEAAEQARTAAARVEEAWQTLHRRFGRHDLLREWGVWVAETVAESRRTGRAAIVVEKLPRRLTVFSAGRAVRVFTVDLGADGLRRKLFAGDRATPEGRYRVAEIKTGSETRFHKALLLDYPNVADRGRYRQAVEQGRVPRGRGIGGLIEIHGHGGRGIDWTDGCVALTDAEMDWLLPRVEIGTPVALVGTLPGADGVETGRTTR